MYTLKYSVDIRAPREIVWYVMTEPDLYRQWTAIFSPDSQFSGKWQTGERIIFFTPQKGGTVALLENVLVNRKILAKHIAVLDENLNEINEGEEVKNWVGSREDYFLEDSEGGTLLRVEIQTHTDWVQMFEKSWPKALKALKDLAEGMVQHPAHP